MSVRTPHLRRLIVIGLCAIVATLATVARTHSIGVLPPKLTPRALEIAAATTRVSVDRPRPLIRNARATPGEYESTQKRAVLIATLMTSRTVVASIAERAELDPRDITALAPVTSGVQTVFNEPDSERRADQIAGASKPYRLEVRANQSLPTLDIYVQAPTVAGALRLADAAVPGTQDYLRSLAEKNGADPVQQMSLDQLGAARGGVVSGGTAAKIALLTFGFVFTLTLLLALSVSRMQRARRARYALAPDVAVGGPANGTAHAATFERPAAARIAAATRVAARRAGDWPRTTRVLPWMVAFLMAIVWLVPFNDIMFDAISLPVDLYLDRLVLPLIIAVWLVALAAGGADAPRLRMTWIHVALGAVVGVACLSLVLEAGAINQTLQFDLAFKKLALLISYVALFVIVASSVRRSEVRAFMTYTLMLAVACGLGTLIEFRFETNVFYSFADAVLPGGFQIGNVDSIGVDEIGRRDVRGPAQASLEVVAMMSMALPIAIARLLECRVTRQRIVYGVCSVVLLAAIVGTFRKSAFLAPISVVLTLMYFRRGDLIKFAPMAVVVVLMIQVLAPGALTGVAGQFDSDKLGVTTVSDRSADYDAIRPDVWSHLVTGRGYGSYEPSSYRILDMELLRQLIEGGVIGLLVYLLMAGAVVAVARPAIRSRGPDAPVALAAAAAAVCFITVSALFDVMSFPHVPYIFLWMAALLAVVAAPPDRAPAAEPVAARRAPIPPPRLQPAWRS